MANRTKLTSRAREQFLEHLRKTANVTDAAALITVRRQYVYEVRDRDPAFKAACDEAIEIATDALEQEARRRALDGWEEPVFYRGEEVGRMRAYSDRLLELLLKAHRPDKYKDTVRQEVTGANGQALAPLVTVYLPSKEATNGHAARSVDVP
jgi:hypothetical protein